MMRLDKLSLRVKKVALVVVSTIAMQTTAMAVPVIPGSSGYGLETPAGRGGTIIRVSNLNDSGSGSLRDCVERSGPRICVFEVSGTIRLTSPMPINEPFLTIAGQTAPSPGIMLRGQTLHVRTSDVLVQHIAVRVGDDPDTPRAEVHDGLRVNGPDPINNVVIDHCSFSWAIDEIAQAWADFDNITWSNNIFAEPLYDSFHTKGPHAMGPLIDTYDGKIALIGNLIAHGNGRNPRSGAGTLLYVNNVTYNHGNNGMTLFNAPGIPSMNTVVGNVFRDGPDTKPENPITLDKNSGSKLNGMLPGTRIHLADNESGGKVGDQWAMVNNHSSISEGELAWSSPLSWPVGMNALSTANDAVLDHVLANAGSRPAERDAVDSRVVNEVRNGTGNIINCVSDDGTERCDKNAGGWPAYAMNSHTLDIPGDPHGDSDNDGYTNVEEWLHEMAAAVEGPGGGVKPPGPTDPVAPLPPEIVVVQ